MNLKRLFADDEAVSPVIGVILMVAITVILAAVIGTFVLGLGDSVSNTAPQVSTDWEPGPDNTKATATLNNGGNVELDDITVLVDSGTGYSSVDQTDWSDGQIWETGTSLDVILGTSSDNTEVDIRLRHEPSDSVIVDTTVESGSGAAP